MTPTQTKISAVALALVSMLLKQYKVHGHIDPIELAEWGVANWDMIFGGLLIGWAFLRRHGDLAPADVQ
jgi:hypothetical protein